MEATYVSGGVIEVRAAILLPNVPEAHGAEAERSAEEAYVMALLRQGDISAGRAAELLRINRTELSELMYRHGISPFDETMTRAELAEEARGIRP